MSLDFDQLPCPLLRAFETEAYECGLQNEPIAVERLSLRDQRILLFYILYAADSFDYQVSVESIIDNLSKIFCINIPAESAVVIQALSIIENRQTLDATLRPFLANWRFERLGVCTRLILRLALWELMHTAIAPTIIINEAIELAKMFAEKDSYKFVNGVLDEVVKRLPTIQSTT